MAEYVAGYLNVFGNIPSHSFGYSKPWHCTNDYEFLSLIKSQFPLLHKLSWQGFRLSFTLSKKVIYELGTKASTLEYWKQLWRIGKRFEGSCVPIANPSELTRTWRKSIPNQNKGCNRVFRPHEKSQPRPWKTGTSWNSVSSTWSCQCEYFPGHGLTNHPPTWVKRQIHPPASTHAQRVWKQRPITSKEAGGASWFYGLSMQMGT